MDSLPVEMLVNIFQFLPAEDCARMKRVSTGFNGIITDKKNAKRMQKHSLCLRIHNGTGPVPVNAVTVSMAGVDVELEVTNGQVQLLSQGAKEQRFFQKFIENGNNLDSFVRQTYLLRPRLTKLVLESAWAASVPVVKELVCYMTNVEVKGTWKFDDLPFLRPMHKYKEGPNLLINRARPMALLLPLLPGLLGVRYRDIRVVVGGEAMRNLLDLLETCFTDVAVPLRLSMTVLNFVAPPSTVQDDVVLSPVDFASFESFSDIPNRFQILTRDGVKMTTVTVERQAVDTTVRFESKLA